MRESGLPLSFSAEASLRLLWNCVPVGHSDESPVVLVDLMHGHLEFVIRTLTISKMIQSVTPCRLVGIVGTPGVVSASTQLDAKENIRLAEIFGLSDVLQVPHEFVISSEGEVTCGAVSALADGHGEADVLPVETRLRLNAVVSSDGYPIGRAITETYLRAELFARIEKGMALDRWTRDVVGFKEWATEAVSRLSPIAFVTGHIDYSPWGVLAEHIVRASGRIVYFRCDARVPIYLIDELGAGETLGGRARRIDTAEFHTFENELRTSGRLGHAVELAFKRMSSNLAGLGRNWRWTKPGDAQQTTQRLFDNDRPTYIAFAHTFTDQPLYDESLFADHSDWLESTLKHASGTRSYNLLVKIHPLNNHYDKSGMADRLEAAFRAFSNIRFTRGPLKPEAAAALCIAAITVRGTPGIEMASLGVPVVLAGKAPYGDVGFTVNPATKKEYFDILETSSFSDGDRWQRREKAALFHAFDRFWSTPASPLCPPFLARDDDEVSLSLSEGAGCASLETDQLRIALGKAWGQRNVRVTTPTFWHSGQ